MIVRHSRSVLLACTAFVTLGLTSISLAQTTEKPAASAGDSTVLQPIVVKGKRVAAKPGSVADTPLASQTTQETILKKNVNNLADFGRTVDPGVTYVPKQGGAFLRGLGGPRITTMVDGVPIPFLSNAARAANPITDTTNADGGMNTFDFQSLSTLDVVRGADSSRAGSGALAGAFVLRTLEPEDLIEPGRDWGGVTKFDYDGTDRSTGGSLAVAKKINNTSVLFQGSYRKGHEIENNGKVDTIGPTRTEANPADYDQNNLLFKLRQQLEGGHMVGITAERFSRDTTTDLKTLQGATTGSSRVYKIGDYDGTEDNRRERVSLDYQFEAPSADSTFDAARMSLYWQRLTREAGAEGTRVGTVAGPWLRNNQIQENDYGLTGNLTSRFATGTFEHEVNIGGDVSLFNATSFIDGLDACILGTASATAKAFSCPNLHADQADIPDVDGARLGLFVDDKISFGNSGFALTPGLRFDWYDYDPKQTAAFEDNPGFAANGLPDGSDGSRFSPKLLATYQVAPAVELFAQWSMAFRAPTINELYLDFSNPAFGYATVGNPDLKPETANGFEIGANFGDSDTGGRVTAFHNLYRNFIDSETSFANPLYPAGLTSYFNRNRVQISGVELEAHKLFDNGINLHGSLAYAYGKDTDTNEYLRSVAPLKAIVGAGYQRETWGTDLSLVTSAGMRSDGNTRTFDAPGYGVVDLTAWWEPEQTKGLRIQGGIYNLFDKTYYNAVALKDLNNTTVPSNSNTAQPLDFYSEPGRVFKISLVQRF